MTRSHFSRLALMAALTAGNVARAEVIPDLSITPRTPALEQRLQEASVFLQQPAGSTPRDWLAAALADYRTLLGVLYSEGYYGAAISIRLNGREVSQIALHDIPDSVTDLAISIRPGPQFRIGSIAIGPRAPSEPSDQDGLRPGDIARSDRIRDDVARVADAWRSDGYAKPQVVQQNITARHVDAELDVAVRIDPGHRATFGQLRLPEGLSVREDRLHAIAGLEAGAVFDPAHLDEVAARLRRSGAFTTVNVTEAETISDDGRLDVLVELVEPKPRRFGLGAEIVTPDGARFTGFWMHRNLTGAADRLRFDAEVAQVGGSLGIDWETSLRYSRPALIGPDSTGFLTGRVQSLDDPAVQSDTIEFGAGLEFQLSQGEVLSTAGQFRRSRSNGAQAVTIFSLPTSWTLDERDAPLNPTSGIYMAATAEPFVATGGDGFGLRSTFEARAYHALSGGIVAAGRFQIGSLMGENTRTLLPDDLFYSGGTGTVRGQGYQSLTLSGAGGRSFAGLETELRIPAPGDFGLVGFLDLGVLGEDPGFGGASDWHAGAGVGLRYDTGIGPLRLDLGVPVAGDTGDGLKVYIGIGQAL